MNNQNISDEYLSSFIDNQLESSEKIQAYQTISQSDNLKDRVCDMRGLKEVIQHAYKQPPPYMQPPLKRRFRWARVQPALIASLFLVLGAASGWMTHGWTNNSPTEPDISVNQQISAISDTATTVRKVIVHVSQSQPVKLQAALDETESLLDSYKRNNQQIQVELIANKQGVNLLRANVSIYENRISLMQKKYPNLNFMVCGKSLGKMRKQGEIVQLLPHTGVATSAADQINKRLQEGWGYVRI